MAPIALGTAPSILAWITIAVALAGALAAVALLSRVLQPARETERYARDILEATQAIGRNLAGVDALKRTRDLATALPDKSAAYLQAESHRP